MKSVLQITLPAVMAAPSARYLWDVLNKGAMEPAALFVGGCVRNAVIDRPIHDIDVATIHTPDTVQTLCKDAGLKTIPTGIDHGTVTVIVEGHTFEVTTLRRDVATDGRRATVAFTTSWLEDAQRRDFTMNTLLADAEGRIYDPTGQGLSDLQQGRVIFVGDPEQRIAEDYLRILRFFRFHAYYGAGDADVKALHACQNAAPYLSQLSRERITQEFLKIVAADCAPGILVLMFDHCCLADLPDEQADFAHFDTLIALEKKHERQSITGRLFSLFGCKETTENRDHYLILSNQQKHDLQRLEKIWAAYRHLAIIPLKKLIYLHGKDMTELFLLQHAVAVDSKNLKTNLAFLDEWNPPRFPISGTDLQAMGMASGYALGKVLNDTEQWWIDEDFTPGREECLRHAQRLLP